MPHSAKTPCRVCRRACRGGYCEAHRRERTRECDERRGTAAQRGYGAAWQRESKRFLDAHPLCADCEERERITAATIVDHIVPHRGDPKLFWDRKNWQGLCETCHNRKTGKGE